VIQQGGSVSADILRQAFDSTERVLANVKPDQLDEPTPCASWKVRDLINHIVAGATFFAITAETGTSPPRGRERPDFAAGDYNTAFHEGAERAVAAFLADDAMEKTMTLPFGQMPGSTFVMIAATDTFTHGWDLAKATGQLTDLDPGLAAQLLEHAKAAVSVDLRGEEGKASFGPRVEVPESASTVDQLAGFLGRRP
jgi:uncharacterized protein (TIGR03086 family)